MLALLFQESDASSPKLAERLYKLARARASFDPLECGAHLYEGERLLEVQPSHNVPSSKDGGREKGNDLDVFLELPYSISTDISLARTWSLAAEGELGTGMVQPNSSDMTG